MKKYSSELSLSIFTLVREIVETSPINESYREMAPKKVAINQTNEIENTFIENTPSRITIQPQELVLVNPEASDVLQSILPIFGAKGIQPIIHITINQEVKSSALETKILAGASAVSNDINATEQRALSEALKEEDLENQELQNYIPASEDNDDLAPLSPSPNVDTMEEEQDGKKKSKSFSLTKKNETKNNKTKNKQEVTLEDNNLPGVNSFDPFMALAPDGNTLDTPYSTYELDDILADFDPEQYLASNTGQAVSMEDLAVETNENNESEVEATEYDLTKKDTGPRTQREILNMLRELSVLRD